MQTDVEIFTIPLSILIPAAKYHAMQSHMCMTNFHTLISYQAAWRQS